MEPVDNSTFSDFCGDYFWDNQESVNATWPDLSPCFQHTVLVWAPFVILCLLSPVLLFKIVCSQAQSLKLKALIVAKIVFSVCLCLVTLVMFVYSIFHSSDDAPVWYVYPLVLFVAMLATAFLLLGCYRKGIITSGVLFLTWLVFFVAGLAEFRYWIGQIVDGVEFNWFRLLLFMLYYLLVCIQLVLSCFADTPGDYRAATIGKENPCPELQTSFLNQLTFWWLTPLVVLGHKRPLERADLWQLNDQDGSPHIVPRFERLWRAAIALYYRKRQAKMAATSKQTASAVMNGEEQVQIISGNATAQQSAAAGKSVAPPSLAWVLFKVFWSTFLFSSLLKLIFDLMQFISPQLLSLLIGFIQDTEAPTWQGVGIAALMFLTAMVQSMVLHQYFHRMFRLGMNMRTVLTNSVFAKALRLSNAARKDRTVGEIVNLMSVDVQRFQDLTNYVMLFWSAPLQILLSIYFLYGILGWAVFGGLFVLILMIPINFFISVKMRKYQGDQMKFKDDRIKMMNELLNGMKILKLYAWEPSMEKMVLEIRRKEIALLRKLAFLNAAMTFTWTSAPFLVAVVSFAVYVLVDPDNNILTPQVTFVSLALFNILRFPLAMLANLVGQAVQWTVSNKRLKSYLASDELDPDIIDRSGKDKENVITIQNGTFTWDITETTEKPTLKEISLVVPQGTLIAVVGTVGCGKTSLLSAMLGEMDKVEGYVNMQGSISYVAQQAWIQNQSLKANVLFGSELDEAFYNRVVDATALRPDFDTLPAGDQTEIGEKGINLSGGQKQRVSLARAVYQQRDIYLLDDPLSAVDSHVGKHIFDQVISNNGLLRGKTRILVTHGLTYLKHVDQIVVLKGGEVSEMGNYVQLIAKGGAFAEFLETHLLEEAKKKELRMEEEISDEESDDDITEVLEELAKFDPTAKNRLVTQISHISIQRGESVDGAVTASDRKPSVDEGKSSRSESKSKSPLRQMSRVSAKGASLRRGSSVSPVKEPLKKPQTEEEKAKLIQSETSETGKVKWTVYLMYIQAIGYLVSFLFVFIYILGSASGVGSNLWLADWSDDSAKLLQNKTMDIDTPVRLSVYAALGIGQALLTCLAAIVMALGMVFASTKLHRELLHNIMRSPMAFFDVTPLGRILNRFGKDVDLIDVTIPITVRMLITMVVSVFATLTVITISMWYFLSVVLPLGIIYYFAFDIDVLDGIIPYTMRAFIMCASAVFSVLFVILLVTPAFIVIIVPLTVIYVYILDISTVDDEVPDSVEELLFCFGEMCETAIVITYATPAILLVIPLLILIYCFMLRFYVSTSRQLKRLESVSRSPIYSHFQETVQGAHSIRAYNAQGRFIADSMEKVDTNLECYYPNICANRWLAVRLEFVGNAIVLFAALFAVLFRDSGVTAGLVGLSVSYALNITQTLNWAVRMTSELETNIVAVERIKEYAETPTEAEWENETERPPKEWPQDGVVEFRDYRTRYRPGLELVLKGITAVVSSGEKIGIVGRTGAGKSSLTLSLFRLIEPADGKILVDGRDITKMGLHDLRTKLTIIPQEPVLFSGTLRMNLDPFQSRTDQELWVALEHSHLKEFVQELTTKLEHLVTEGGENLSVGQRQLVCLARALLRKTKVLILDEATAAVDVETDALIQKTIRQEFADCTVLTIAHRLNTILDSDRVMVLADGNIQEFDSPANLLANEQSEFYSMCKDANLV